MMSIQFVVSPYFIFSSFEIQQRILILLIVELLVILSLSKKFRLKLFQIFPIQFR